MSPDISKVYPNYQPTSWREFDAMMPGIPLGLFGFAGNLADINRWAARYRAAAAFRELSLAGYQSAEIVRGYGALVWAVLVWSAFERFLAILGIDQAGSNDMLVKYGAADLARAVRERDEGDRLYSFVRERVNTNRQRRELGSYITDEPCNVSYLLSAIRHIFGHGYLTPSANEASADTVASICDLLSDFHLGVMDHEFTERVREVQEMVYGPP